MIRKFPSRRLLREVLLGLRYMKPVTHPSDPPTLRCSGERTRSLTPGAPLERISIELSRHCNLRCLYCYSQASSVDPGGLTDDETRRIVAEAAELGSRLVSIVAGGEPLLRRSVTEQGQSLIDYCNELGCYCYLYTNCTLVTPKVASFLRERDVSVVGKLNSLRESVQDELVGMRGAAKRIWNGIDALLEAGLTTTLPSRLALETIVCPVNYEEIPTLWHWMRTRNVVPEIEIPTLHGRALEHLRDVAFEPSEAPRKYEALFDELARIDRETYGFQWNPHPPFPGASCRLFENNCYINAQGGVQPCAGVDSTIARLRVGSFEHTGLPLATVVTLPAFRALREVRQRIAAPCRDCELLTECYGCRGAAYQATGDIFAADPVCWRSREPRTAAPCVSRCQSPVDCPSRTP